MVRPPCINPQIMQFFLLKKSLTAAEQRKMGKRTFWCTMASPGLKTFNVRNLVAAASSYVETMLLSRHSELELEDLQ